MVSQAWTTRATQLWNAVVCKATMSSPILSLHSFDSYEQWDPYDDTSQQRTQTNNLKLCQFPDWDSEGTYDDDPPIYIHYSIVWKVTRNKRAVVGPDT
ncbi:uncharacterized protein LY89DRAFT_788283, partial [Mollisia scopiformis]